MSFLSAICRPLSTLVYKRSRVLTSLLLIWLLSTLISLPEAIILTSVGFLNDKDKFPCITEDIFWDLSTCEPSWGTDQVFIYTIIKVIWVFIQLMRMCWPYFIDDGGAKVRPVSDLTSVPECPADSNLLIKFMFSGMYPVFDASPSDVNSLQRDY